LRTLYALGVYVVILKRKLEIICKFTERVFFSCISPYLSGEFKILQHVESECNNVVQRLFSWFCGL
jgi:hypothetical protein